MNKKYTISILSIIIAFVLGVSSCKDDQPLVPEGRSTYAKVITTDLTNRTYYSASLGGIVPQQTGISFSSRGLVWCTNEFPATDDNLGINEEGYGTGEFDSELSGLDPETTYYVRAYAETNNGIAYGNQISFTTLKENTVIDTDGNIYPTIKIGDQEWIAENLRVTHYNDNTPINSWLTNALWSSTDQGAYSVYTHTNVDGIGSLTEMTEAYGVLYNWYAVNDSKGLCPVGWKIPSHQDWQVLIDHVETQGGNGNEGNMLKSCRQANSPLGDECETNNHPRWDANEVHHGTDDFGFAGLPGGFRNYNGNYANIGQSTFWWSSTGLGDNYAWYRSLFYDDGSIISFAKEKNMGYAVRCIKN